MRTLKLLLVALAGYLLFQAVEVYLDHKSTPAPRKKIKPVGTQVGGTVLTGGGTGTRSVTDGPGGQHTATVVGRGVVSRNAK